MSASPDCRAVEELVPELALGIATGDDRARALGHLASCASCRKLLDEMSGVADELLLLGPSHEPPVGFESRVIERLQGRRRPRWPRVAALAAAAALVAGGIGIAATLQMTKDERGLGEAYARTLQAAGGKYFAAAPLRAAGGAEIGHAFGYEGSPSWLYVTVADPGRGGTYGVEVERGGRSTLVGSIQVRDGLGSWGGVLEDGFHGIDAVTLVARSGARVEASFH